LRAERDPGTRGIILVGEIGGRRIDDGRSRVDAGLDRVTVSLDSIDPDVFRLMNGVGLPVESVSHSPLPKRSLPVTPYFGVRTNSLVLPRMAPQMASSTAFALFKPTPTPRTNPATAKAGARRLAWESAATINAVRARKAAGANHMRVTDHRCSRV